MKGKVPSTGAGVNEGRSGTAEAWWFAVWRGLQMKLAKLSDTFGVHGGKN